MTPVRGDFNIIALMARCRYQYGNGLGGEPNLQRRPGWPALKNLILPRDVISITLVKRLFFVKSCFVGAIKS